MSATPGTAVFQERFNQLADSDSDMQCEFFLKSFIFALGDDWKVVPALLKEWKQHLRDNNEEQNLNSIQASGFLQQHGKTRTATQRNHELGDIDLNKDGRIAFIEYLMLHYKVLILTEYYKRYDTTPEEDLSTDGIGITEVGAKLMDELFTMPDSMNPALEEAIEVFTTQQREKAARRQVLEEKAAAGGVKGMAAAQELRILTSADSTEENRIELTLQAAKRRAAKMSGEEHLQEQKRKEEAEMKKQSDESRAKLAARRAIFEGK